MQGKLKKILKTICPECEHHLQLRSVSVKEMVRGEYIYIDNDVVICPECGYVEKGGQSDRNKIGYRIKESFG